MFYFETLPKSMQEHLVSLRIGDTKHNLRAEQGLYGEQGQEMAVGGGVGQSW